MVLLSERQRTVVRIKIYYGIIGTSGRCGDGEKWSIGPE